MFTSIATMSWIWFIVLIVLVVLEASTQALVSIWGAISALLMIFLSRTALPAAYQILIFLVLTIVLLVFTRPLALASKKRKEQKDSLNTLIGVSAVLQSPITAFEKGRLTTPNGVSWTASSEDGSEIPAGRACTVVDVQGNTLIVKLKEN